MGALRVEKLPRETFRPYLKKAEAFQRTMEKAAAAGDWNAVGLNAVHAVISASDAVTTFYLGERSRGEDHNDAAQLLRRLPLEEAGERAEHALKVLRAKNLVEYEAREFEAREALAVMKRTTRFVGWAMEHLRS